MGTGMPGDKEKTLEQLKCPAETNTNVTWLRHRIKSQSGMIDMMLLEGGHRIEDMAVRLQASFPDRSFEPLCKRVRDHIDHLQEGDARDHSTLHLNDHHRPHFLKLFQKDGRWYFDQDQ